MPKVSETILLDDTMLGPEPCSEGFEYILFTVIWQLWETPKGKRRNMLRRAVQTIKAPTEELLEKELLNFIFRDNVECRDGVEWGDFMQLPRRDCLRDINAALAQDDRRKREEATP